MDYGRQIDDYKSRRKREKGRMQFDRSKYEKSTKSDDADKDYLQAY